MRALGRRNIYSRGVCACRRVSISWLLGSVSTHAAIMPCRYLSSGERCPYGCLPHLSACHDYGRHRCRRSKCRKVHCRPGHDADGEPLPATSGHAAPPPMPHTRPRSGAALTPRDSARARRHSPEEQFAPGETPPTRDACRTATGWQGVPPNHLSIEQALEVLGLKYTEGAGRGIGTREDYTEDAVQRAWRSLIRCNHPDRSGPENTLMASYLNGARDVLLTSLKRPCVSKTRL